MDTLLNYEKGEQSAKKLGYTPSTTVEVSKIPLQETLEKLGLRFRITSQYETEITLHSDRDSILRYNFKEENPDLLIILAAAAFPILFHREKYPHRVTSLDISKPNYQEFCAGFLATEKARELKGKTYAETILNLQEKYHLSQILSLRAFEHIQGKKAK